MSIIWHNGEFKGDEPVFLSNDRIRLGDGVFDTMLAIEGNPIYAEEHHERLLRHAATLNINAAYKFNDLTSIHQNILARNNLQHSHAVINTIISRGPAQRGLTPPQTPNIQLVIRAAEAPQAISSLNLIISKNTRRNEGSPLSQIKSFNYGDNILCAIESQQKDADDAIILNNKDNITCTTIGNIFICNGNNLITPPLSDGTLDGILRTKILHHFSVKERSITTETLLNSSGVYVTNSVRGAVPVYSINGTNMPEPSVKIPDNFHFRDFPL